MKVARDLRDHDMTGICHVSGPKERSMEKLPN